MAVVLGVDGCPGGWVGALVDGAAVTWLVLSSAREVLDVPAAGVGIDIPIGLPTTGPRRCDIEARAALGARRASVFPAPVRAVLGAADYADACHRSRVVTGKALSKQAWFLVERIADVDTALRRSPGLHRRVVEVHPELVFARLAGDLPGKKVPAGRLLREQAMRSWLPGGWPAPPRPARPDDALDALACAWTTARWLRGGADVLGDEVDATGTPMRIVV